jgi:hypothetical protein
MSSYDDYDDDLQDPYERSSGGGGAPVVSWKFVKAGGDKFVGVVLPPVVTGPKANTTKGYEMRRDWQAGTDTDPDDKGFLVWPPRDNTEGIKRPVTERKHKQLWPDIDISARDSQGRRIVRQVSRTNVTFHTAFTGAEFISESTEARMKERDMDPTLETQRRIILNSRDLEDKLNAAFKAIKTDRPQPGQVWTIGIQERKPNVGRQGSTTVYTVDVKAPTPETMKIVQAHVEAEQAKANDAADVADPGDPWATPVSSVPASNVGSDGVPDGEPPF